MQQLTTNDHLPECENRAFHIILGEPQTRGTVLLFSFTLGKQGKGVSLLADDVSMCISITQATQAAGDKRLRCAQTGGQRYAQAGSYCKAAAEHGAVRGISAMRTIQYSPEAQLVSVQVGRGDQRCGAVQNTHLHPATRPTCPPKCR